jgi:hypothetical protein
MLYALFFIWFSLLKAWNISDSVQWKPAEARGSPPKPAEARRSPPKPAEARRSPPKPAEARQLFPALSDNLETF